MNCQPAPMSSFTLITRDGDAAVKTLTKAAQGVGIAKWLECWTQTRDAKVVGSVIQRLLVQVTAGSVGEFSSLGSTFCVDSYFSIHSTPLLPH